MKRSHSSDADLVTQSLAGDRDAFGWIVARYQALLCSLAYSTTGSLSQSEDLAQETFVTAWKQLADLREPEKLRAWLCRISRNLTYDALRKDGREPIHKAEPLTVSAKAAAVGVAAAKSSTTAKAAGVTGVFGLSSALAVGLLGNYIGYRTGIDGAQSDLERAHIRRFYRKLITWMLGFLAAYGLLLILAKPFIRDRHLVFSSVIIGLVLPFTFLVFAGGMYWLLAPRKFLAQLTAHCPSAVARLVCFRWAGSVWGSAPLAPWLAVGRCLALAPSLGTQLVAA